MTDAVAPLQDIAIEPSLTERVMEFAVPSRTYYTLLVLSAVIASFGLVANSTATVIGAMIVAPLMGPILGIALSLVTGDVGGMRKSAKAEILGVIGCFLTACLIAWVVGPANIDYYQGEIAGRTSPTLYDLAVGFAAGLAGAYATLRPRISGSIAGVAIAVALVPPVAVTGLATAAAVQDIVPWKTAFSAFLLFLANFVTIEIAAALVFWLLTDAHVRQKGGHLLTRGLAVSLVLLAVVAAFLAQQLFTLIAQRRLLAEVRHTVQEQLDRIPRTSLYSVSIDRNAKPTRVRLVLRASEPIPDEVTTQIHRQIETFAGHVQLSVVTLATVDYSAPGSLEAPADSGETPERKTMRAIETALKEVLREHPRVDLVSFRRLNAPTDTLRLFLTLRTPQVYDAEYVTNLETQMFKALHAQGQMDWSRVELTVRSLPSQDFTSQGPVDRPIDADTATRNLAREREMELLREAATSYMADLPAELVSLELGVGPLAGSDAVDVRITVRSRTWLTRPQVDDCAERLAVAAGQAVNLRVENMLGQTTEAQATPPPAPTPTPEDMSSPGPADLPSPGPTARPSRGPMSPSPAATRSPHGRTPKMSPGPITPGPRQLEKSVTTPERRARAMQRRTFKSGQHQPEQPRQ